MAGGGCGCGCGFGLGYIIGIGIIASNAIAGAGCGFGFALGYTIGIDWPLSLSYLHETHIVRTHTPTLPVNTFAFCGDTCNLPNTLTKKRQRLFNNLASPARIECATITGYRTAQR